MGRASHWASTARWLSARHRRGRPRPARPRPQRQARRTALTPGRPTSTDAEAAMEQLGLAPVVLIGHAMGALTAWQLAAKRPDLVRGADHLRHAGLRARRGLAARVGGVVPRLAAALRHARRRPQVVRRGRPLGGAAQPVPRRVLRRGDGRVRRTAGAPSSPRSRCSRSRETWVYDAHWEELAQVRCPTLVVRGLDGELGRAEAQEMVRVLPARPVRGGRRRRPPRPLRPAGGAGARPSSRSWTARPQPHRLRARRPGTLRTVRPPGRRTPRRPVRARRPVSPC